MNKKGKLIIILIIIGAVMFSIIQFGIIPKRESKQKAYNISQLDSLTHDINNVMKYKSKYIGDNSNTINLFYNLPLNNISMKFQIDSENCILTVSYMETVLNIGKEKAERDLIYNSAAAFALIDNISAIKYELSGSSYSFERTDFEKEFGTPLSSLMTAGVWQQKVQNQLNNSDFVNKFYTK